MEASSTAQTCLERIGRLATEFAQDRSERQRRRELDPTDFEQLREAGFLLMAVPVECGGGWESPARSIRPLCQMVRTLARGDPSVALVCTMHPAVLVPWLLYPHAPPPYTDAWAAQRRWIFTSARDGAWWGTIVSEPGTGGDVSRTRAVARLDPASGAYRVTGQKQFGSGAGMAGFMITTAVPQGEDKPDTFILDLRGVPFDGSAGVTLVAPWDGHGMIATQSHALRFEDFLGERVAWPRGSRQLAGIPQCLWIAVMLGVVDVAMETARQQLSRRPPPLHAYEQVEWSRAEMEYWLVQQAYTGLLQTIEAQGSARREAVLAKIAAAELVEAILSRISRVLGGGTYSRHTPFGWWFEDVRALGFLRPPWALAFDEVFAGSWEQPE